MGFQIVCYVPMGFPWNYDAPMGKVARASPMVIYLVLPVHESPIGLPWVCSAPIGLPRDSHGPAAWVESVFIRGTLIGFVALASGKTPWVSNGMPMWTPCVRDAPTGLPWNFHGITVLL